MSTSEEARSKYREKYWILSTPESKRRFNRFLINKTKIDHLDEVGFDELDWLLVHALADNRCMASGVPLEQGEAHVDQSYDDCDYRWGEIMILFGGLNFSKGSCPEFKSQRNSTGGFMPRKVAETYPPLEVQV